MGACLGDLCLDKYTGDGKFDGEAFLGRLLIFFLGERGRGRGSVRASPAESFFTGLRALSNSPIFYVIYYMLSSGGFADVSFRSSRKVPSTSMSWSDTCDVQASTIRRPVLHTEDSEGTSVLRSVTDSTEQWVWCFMHMKYFSFPEKKNIWKNKDEEE